MSAQDVPSLSELDRLRLKVEAAREVLEAAEAERRAVNPARAGMIPPMVPR